MKKKKRQAEQCIEDILLENYDRYYRLAYSYTHNEADAEDIVQNGVYKAILYSDSLENPAYAKTWIYRIMLNETFEMLKKQRDTSLEELVLEMGKEDRYADIDLLKALNSMSKEDKAVIELRYFEDLKISDIAQILGENVNTIKSRLYRGLKKMKLELSDAWKWEA